MASPESSSTVPLLMQPLRNYLKELLTSSESDVEAARVADDMVLTWKKVGFNGWEIENKVKESTNHPTEMTRLQSNFYGKLERKTRDPFPKSWRGYGCEFLAKQTIKFYSAYLQAPPPTPTRRHRSPP